MNDFNAEWLIALDHILSSGKKVSPRGKLTKEILQRTLTVDMKQPVLTIPDRKLSYQFMAAEAYWILSGDYRVETIAPYNKHISQFSDDGKTFAGAYGPKIQNQLNYVIHALYKDPDTRQAGLTIWRENPTPSKDIPCTVALFFNIRDDLLNCHAFMRSSDVWLGIPYDVFNFSMLSHLICAHLHGVNIHTRPGQLFLTAASSHLYEQHFEQAKKCLEDYGQRSVLQVPMALSENPVLIMDVLRDLRDSKPGMPIRWWENNNATTE
jgi:thymidylate synthase